MISDKERNLAETVIKLHDGKSYSLLQDISMPPDQADEEDRITEAEYLEMCQDIERDVGELQEIELIECLDRADSKLGLWKVSYSKTKYKVLWAIGFDPVSLKVQDVMVQW